MKKIIVCLLMIISIFLTSCGDWSLSYSEQAEYEGWSAALDMDHHRAFVSGYVWDGDMSEDGRRIVIPETVEGCTVKKLGGYFGRGLPMPFQVATPNAGTEGKEVINPEDPKPLVFTLVVNESLNEVENVMMASADDPAPDRIYLEEADGKVCAWDIYWRVEVDPKNKTFYEKEGKLYQKTGDKLITALYYEKP